MFFFSQNENMSRIGGKNRISFWVSPPNPEPEDFLALSFWKLKFRFKTRMNRARDLVYQCFSVESALNRAHDLVYQCFRVESALM